MQVFVQLSDAGEQRSGGCATTCNAGPRDTADYSRSRHAADTAADAERSSGTSRVRLHSCFGILSFGSLFIGVMLLIS